MDFRIQHGFTSGTTFETFGISTQINLTYLMDFTAYNKVRNKRVETVTLRVNSVTAKNVW